MNDWQPIETAPMDGSLFLAVKAGVFQIGKMGKITRSKGGTPLRWEQVDSFLSFPSNCPWNPTHWMPLPPPPEPGETKETT